jgi:hypothetical protein
MRSPSRVGGLGSRLLVVVVVTEEREVLELAHASEVERDDVVDGTAAGRDVRAADRAAVLVAPADGDGQLAPDVTRRKSSSAATLLAPPPRLGAELVLGATPALDRRTRRAVLAADARCSWHRPDDADPDNRGVEGVEGVVVIQVFSDALASSQLSGKASHSPTPNQATLATPRKSEKGCMSTTPSPPSMTFCNEGRGSRQVRFLVRFGGLT